MGDLGFRDNPGNILGANSSNNQYDSSSVAANADGSLIERTEYIQTVVDAITTGNVILQGAADAGTNSTTVIPIAGLAGYGNDFFNTRFFMQVLLNSDDPTAAPEAEVRQITDYVSATGTFICTAFSAAVEASDLCLILHESQVAIGRDDSNNTIATTNVAANVDGSVLERLEDLKDRVDAVDNYVDAEVAAIKAVTDAIPDAGALTTLAADVTAVKGYLSGTDSASNVLGANDNNNGFDSSNVAADDDGSVLERLEDLKARIDAVDDYVDAEVAAIKAVTDVIPDAGALTTIDAAITAIKAVTDVIPDAGALTALAADVTAVKAVTDVIPDAGALTALAADVTAVKAVTDVIPDAGALTALAADVTAVKAVTDVIPDAGALTDLLADVAGIKAGGGIGSGIVRKTVTFSNTAADVNLFTVTGAIIARLIAVCTTNVESAAGCNIGVDCGSTALIADTDCTTIEAGDIWHDATPDSAVEAVTVLKEYIIANGTTILLDVEGAKQVDSGVLKFYLIWTALSSDGEVAAA